MLIPPDSVRRLLVRGTNWLGDSVMTIPALRAVRAAFPGAHLTLMVRPWVSDLFQHAPYLDDLLIYDKRGPHQGLSGLRRIVETIRARSFDLAILFQNALEAALIARLAGIPRRVGYPRDGRGWLLTHTAPPEPALHGRHQIFYYLGILSGAGLIDDAPWLRLDYQPDLSISVTPEECRRAQYLLDEGGVEGDRPLVGLNPGAYFGPAKRWTTDRYAALADRLIERVGAQVVIFGSADERRIAMEIAGLMRHKPAILAGRTTLRELMALIRSCRLLITNDSGPMHVAAALGVPQLALFGSTDATATGPYNRHATVIRHAVPCSPCLLRECPIDLRCFTAISVDEVYAAAQRKLDTYGSVV